MNQLYSLAREMTNLTDVQIRILDHMEAALQFAADISKKSNLHLRQKEKMKV